MAAHLAWAGALAGCHASSSSGSEAPTGPIVRFDLHAGVGAAGAATPAVPALLDVPYPSDVYLQNGKPIEPPGIENLVPQNSQFIAHEIAKLNGFSRVALALFSLDDFSLPARDDGTPASAQIDTATLPADERACVADTSSVFLVDLQPAPGASARVPCRAVFQHDYLSPKARTYLARRGPARTA
jgi:hypothetical protein